MLFAPASVTGTGREPGRGLGRGGLREDGGGAGAAAPTEKLGLDRRQWLRETGRPLVESRSRPSALPAAVPRSLPRSRPRSNPRSRPPALAPAQAGSPFRLLSAHFAGKTVIALPQPLQFFLTSYFGRFQTGRGL